MAQTYVDGLALRRHSRGVPRGATMAQLYAEASGSRYAASATEAPTQVTAEPVYAHAKPQGPSAAALAAHGKLLPIGEGAYQSAEAVMQRTRDSRRHCEDGDWNNCFGKDKSDFLDGHSYGHLAPEATPAPKATTTEASSWR